MSNDQELVVLRSALDNLSQLTNNQWMEGLSNRKLAELKFHDSHRERTAAPKLDQDTYERFYGNKKYYSATEASKEYVHSWIKTHSPGKVVLDYACGNGENAIRAASHGASLAIGIDISPVSVDNARQDAAKAGVSDKTFFVQADCENTKLPDNSVDTLICSGMLHHLDLSYAFPEMRRILKPGGKILAVEALDYNPAIKLYRMRTPEMRTEWEKAHILSLKDVRFGERFFDVGDIKYWHITSILSPHLKGFGPALNAIDGVLTRIPYVQRMAWIFTFELIKRAD
jgi:ubiquinone/menaquinone biosynthesis C-methylase UbiE